MIMMVHGDINAWGNEGVPGLPHLRKKYKEVHGRNQSDALDG